MTGGGAGPEDNARGGSRGCAEDWGTQAAVRVQEGLGVRTVGSGPPGARNRQLCMSGAVGAGPGTDGTHRSAHVRMFGGSGRGEGAQVCWRVETHACLFSVPAPLPSPLSHSTAVLRGRRGGKVAFSLTETAGPRAKHHWDWGLARLAGCPDVPGAVPSSSEPGRSATGWGLWYLLGSGTPAPGPGRRFCTFSGDALPSSS